MKFIFFCLFTFVLLSLGSHQSFADASSALLDQGRYLIGAAGCADCHTPGYDRPFAGGIKLNAKLGGIDLTFFTPNISPDDETGIGKWTELDFTAAMRTGISPRGSYYYPVFPWRSYTKMSDDDLHAMYAYLQTLEPISNQPPKTDLGFPIYNQRWLLWFWRTVFFTASSSPIENLRTGPGPFQPLSDKTDSWNRGAYLVEGVMHCAECHSPRNFEGAPIADKWMSGSDIPFGGLLPRNITPANLKWSRPQWLRFLASGREPGGGQPAREMAQVIKNTARLTDEDRAAVAEYLMNLDPVEVTP